MAWEDRNRVAGPNDNLEAAVNGRLEPKNIRKSVEEWCAIQDKTANIYVFEIVI